MVSAYSFIVLFATVLGAIAGLGGGVIIKPLFDMLGFHDASTIGVYSSLAVFTMCLVSILKQLKSGFKFDKAVVIFISLGSCVGGLLGERIFNLIASNYSNGQVKVIQALLLAVTLILILIYTLNKSKIKQFKLKNKLLVFLAGVVLGCISVFLGIGGGPLNVATVMILFSYDMKEATIYSIATIFFSQVSKLGSVYLANKFAIYDLSIVPFICVSAIIGGMIGTNFNQKFSNKKVEKIYVYLIVSLILTSGYNIISNLL